MTPARWALLGSLYITQFLALGFFFIALVAILRRERAPLESLSIISLLGLVWVVKVLWAPLVDRIRFGRLGHYRGWLILMQGGIVLTVLAIGRFDVVADFEVVFGLCLLLAVLCATQDIAADGLACRLLSRDQRGVGNGLQIAGGLLGNMLGGGVVLMLYPTIGWSGAMLVLALGVAVPLVQLLRFREPVLADGRDQVGALRTQMRRLVLVWRQPGGGRWLVLLSVYPLGIGLVYYLATPMLVDAGWSMEHVGFVMNVVGSLIGVASALAAGMLVRRVGRRRMLVAVGVAQVIALAAFLLPATGASGSWAVVGPLCLLFVTYSPVATVLCTMMMDRATPEHAATDFTAQYTVYTLVATVGGALAFQLAAVLGYPGVVMLAVAMASLAAVGASLLYQDPGTARAEPDLSAPLAVPSE
ncbi:MFS transporter [Roseospira marina]|uniref:MFS transporter n=2 Tax=Roseospira marina TaxID=140057 RepID=A0A5M6I7R6_9PROT|nr:MFS transporter [Roseospira marina]